MVHIDNIEHILQNGITHSKSQKSNPNFVSIGDISLISARNNFLLKNGRNLGEYIPFYFAKKTPMLYVLQNGFNMVSPTPAENIIYCVSSVQKILDLNLDFVFTDGHARDTFSSQFTIEDIINIDSLIDRNAINSKYWKDDHDLDLKRRKEAEFLVFGDIDKSAILGYIAYNEIAKSKILKLGLSNAQVQVIPDFYF